MGLCEKSCGKDLGHPFLESSASYSQEKEQSLMSGEHLCVERVCAYMFMQVCMCMHMHV